MRTIFVLLASLLLTTNSFSSEHLLYGKPSVQGTLERNAYVISYDFAKRVPTWVAYVIKPEYVSKAGRDGRFSSYQTDPDIDNPVRKQEYTNFGFDRGHIAPWAISGGDRDNDGLFAALVGNSDLDDEQTIFEINYMSNMAPSAWHLL